MWRDRQRLILLSILTLSGCQVTNAVTLGTALMLAKASTLYDTVELHIVDVDKRTPVSGAEVEVVYPVGSWGGTPDRFLGKADTGGRIKVRIARDHAGEIRVSAQGYEPLVFYRYDRKVTVPLVRRSLAGTMPDM